MFSSSGAVQVQIETLEMSLRAALPTLECAPASSAGLVKTQTESVGLGWDLRFHVPDVDLLVCGCEAFDMTQLCTLCPSVITEVHPASPSKVQIPGDLRP